MLLPARPLVLCYHAVSDGWEDELAVTPAAFEQQIREVLRAGYRPAGAIEAATGRGKLVHVTFDDAFCSIRGALDLLCSLGVSATVFACSDLADAGLPLPAAALGAERAAPAAEGATMTWAELAEHAERGITIGSHTCSHPHLPEISDDELTRELTESRRRIEDELGRPCAVLAYPFGDHDARVRDAARKAGYTIAFAQGSSLDDPFGLCRVSVYRRDTLGRFRLKRTPVGRRLAASRRA